MCTHVFTELLSVYFPKCFIAKKYPRATYDARRANCNPRDRNSGGSFFEQAIHEYTHIALKGEGIGILDVLVLEVVEVDLGEVGVDGDRVVGGQPVVLHAAAAILLPWGVRASD